MITKELNKRVSSPRRTLFAAQQTPGTQAPLSSCVAPTRPCSRPISADSNSIPPAAQAKNLTAALGSSLFLTPNSPSVSKLGRSTFKTEPAPDCLASPPLARSAQASPLPALWPQPLQQAHPTPLTPSFSSWDLLKHNSDQVPPLLSLMGLRAKASQ